MTAEETKTKEAEIEAEFKRECDQIDDWYFAITEPNEATEARYRARIESCAWARRNALRRLHGYE